MHRAYNYFRIYTRCDRIFEAFIFIWPLLQLHTVLCVRFRKEMHRRFGSKEWRERNIMLIYMIDGNRLNYLLLLILLGNFWTWSVNWPFEDILWLLFFHFSLISTKMYAYLTYRGSSGEQMTCVGHSLGAHICGMVSNHLTSKQHKIIGKFRNGDKKGSVILMNLDSHFLCRLRSS